MKDLLEPIRARRKIKEVLKDNENISVQPKQNIDEPGPIRNVLGGLFSGLATTPLSIAGMVEAIPTVSYNLTKAALDKDYGVSDALVDTMASNKSFQAASYVDDKIRDVMGLKRYEDLSGGEQLASLTGEFLPIVATGGTSGIVKLGNKAAQKAAIRLAKKKAVKSGKALSSSAIEKAKNSADTAVNMLLPGVQVTKDASLGQKATEIGLQAGIPLGINEAVRYSSDQEGIFGDYRSTEPKEITLINDKRKIKGKTFVDELAPGIVSDYILDQKAAINNEKSEKLKTGALVAAGLLGSVAATRKLRSLFNKEKTALMPSMPKTNESIDALDAKTVADMTLADRFAFKKQYVDQGLISEETANKLTRDTRSRINKAFETGDLYDGVVLDFSPQSTYNKLNNLRLQNPVAYKNIEQFLEESSKIQDEVHRFNKDLLKNGTYLTPDEYITKKTVLSKEQSYNYTEESEFAKTVKARKLLLDRIDKDPVQKQIVDEISKISDALLRKMELSGMYDQQEIAYLRKNRTVGGIFTYKPRVAKNETDLYKKFWNYLFRKTPLDAADLKNMNYRGTDKIKEAYSYLDVFEMNFKHTLQDIEDNTIKRQTIKEMLNKTVGKINTTLDTFRPKYEEILTNPNIHDKKGAIISLDRQIQRDIDKLFVVQPLGYTKIDSSDIVANKSFYDILNRPKKDSEKLTKTLNELHSQSKENFSKWDKDKKYVLIVEDNGKKYYYKVNENIKAAFDLNTTLPSMLAYHMKSLKNIVQASITGKLNPAFSFPSAIMASHEALTLLPKLAHELNIAPNNISRWGYIKEFKNAASDIYASETAKQIIKQYDKVITKNLEQSVLAEKLANINIEEVRSKLNASLLTQIQKEGGASSRPLNTNAGAFYELRKNTVISDKIEKFLLKHDGIDGAIQKLNMINFLQSTIRETPSVALTRYLGKQAGAIKDNVVIDPKKLQKVIDTIGTYTANIGRSGVSTGTLGALFRGIENYVPYGNVMIKSLAPKVRASGISTGIENIYNLVSDLYNPSKRYVDILHNMHRYSTDLLKNKFFEGLIITSMMPSLFQYVWNHGSEKNRQAYYQLSDYEKASKFILVNLLGDGKHLSLAKDQEVALADSIFTTLLDGVVGMSRYNEVDPAFKQSKLIMQSLARSIGIDSIPALDIIANTQGKEVNLNIFNDRPLISDLSRNKINADLSETAYENGLVNQETTALVNSLFGIVGSTLLGSFEEANVGTRNDTGFNDFGQKLFEGATKSAKLFGSKPISSYNQTSKTVYSKQNLINRIASVQNKSPVQAQAYEIVKSYNRNRIKPVHDMITDIRKSINSIRANGRMPDGTLLDFNGRRAKISELNEQLQQLFAREYHEFENLDNLLEQQYGNGINLNNFMEKLQ